MTKLWKVVSGRYQLAVRVTLALLGTVIVIGALAADLIGIGDQAGFGLKQAQLAIAGVLLLCVSLVPHMAKMLLGRLFALFTNMTTRAAESSLSYLEDKPFHVLSVIAGVLFLLHSFSLVWDYSQNSLQMDLSTFYVAGEALRHGLNPYVNNYPTVWTGADVYKYSGFLYPPIAAFLFQGFTIVPYHVLKTLWSFLNPVFFLLVGVLIWVWLRDSVGRSHLTVGFCLFTMAAMASFPMRAELERGQVDIVLLLLVVAALYMIEVRGRKVTGGFLLGLSAILKLHTVYLIPFLLFRRHSRAVFGSVLSLSLSSCSTHSYPLLPRSISGTSCHGYRNMVRPFPPNCCSMMRGYPKFRTGTLPSSTTAAPIPGKALITI